MKIKFFPLYLFGLMSFPPLAQAQAYQFGADFLFGSPGQTSWFSILNAKSQENDLANTIASGKPGMEAEVELLRTAILDSLILYDMDSGRASDFNWEKVMLPEGAAVRELIIQSHYWATFPEQKSYDAFLSRMYQVKNAKGETEEFRITDLCYQRDIEGVRRHLMDFVKKLPPDGVAWNSQHMILSKLEPKIKALRESMEKNGFAGETLELAAECEKIYSRNHHMIYVQLLLTAVQKKDQVGVNRIMRFFHDKYKDTELTPSYVPEMLNGMAWHLMADRAKPGVDLGLALEMVNRAIELAPENPHMRDTRAHIYMAQGKQDEAIAAEAEALALCGEDDPYRKYCEQVMAGFKEGKFLPSADEGTFILAKEKP